MDATKTEDATVVVIYQAEGIFAGCARCQTILAEGLFMIGITVAGHKYVVANNPPIICCGEKKKVPRIFADEVAANKAQKEVADTLRRDGNTSNVFLLEFSVFVSTAVH